ncbi:MAG: FG-GAP repeat protein [Myxococcales bacterium]|nr:FG-GAP repeat protein [Myxococcales bacterium]
MGECRCCPRRLEGRVVIYDLVLGAWQVTQLIPNPTPLANDYFGLSVALNAEGLLLVGDPRDIQGGLETGAVYVYPLVGDPCTNGSTCASGLCEDTVCCDISCGPCGDCNVAGLEGQCQILADGEEATGCSPNLCDGTTAECPACVDEMDCVAGHFCDAGTCLPLFVNGEACTEAGRCLSGLCVDGFCCNSSCEEQCQACDVTGSLGTCTNVTGAPHGNRTPCSGPTCSEDVAYDDYQCAGALTCERQTITPCSPFTCGDTSCRIECASNSQCQEGFFCRIETGECLTTDTLCDGSTLRFPDGTTQDCGAYRCSDAGECYASCTSGVPCSDGYAAPRQCLHFPTPKIA